LPTQAHNALEQFRSFKMRTKLAVASLLASTLLLSTAALAQQTPPPAGSAPAATSAAPSPIPDKAKVGHWRASKMIGLDVYNEQNEKLGDISEVLLDRSGKVNGIVIGVGGFLGVGQRDIMVGMDKLKFVNEPMRTSAAPAPSGTGTTGTGTPPAARTDRAASQWYPDHAILAGVNKDQLKSMPEFKYE
jgi:sporulation protein YlmC with PRC-barrel domain